MLEGLTSGCRHQSVRRLEVAGPSLMTDADVRKWGHAAMAFLLGNGWTRGVIPRRTNIVRLRWNGHAEAVCESIRFGEFANSEPNRLQRRTLHERHRRDPRLGPSPAPLLNLLLEIEQLGDVGFPDGDDAIRHVDSWPIARRTYLLQRCQR